jgi:hypothetical protein
VTVVLVVLVIVVVALLVWAGRMRAAAHRARIRAAASVGGAEVVRSEDVRTVKRTVGDRPILGNATLVLTENELILAQWNPPEDVVVPLRAIRKVDKTRAEAGRGISTELVRVKWRVGGGQQDTLSFQPRDRDAWLAELGATKR